MVQASVYFFAFLAGEIFPIHVFFLTTVLGIGRGADRDGTALSGLLLFSRFALAGQGQ